MLERSTVDWKSRQYFSLGETKGLNDALNLFLATGKAVMQQTWDARLQAGKREACLFEWHKMFREEI
jgi:hypothetical protein